MDDQSGNAFSEQTKVQLTKKHLKKFIEFLDSKHSLAPPVAAALYTERSAIRSLDDLCGFIQNFKHVLETERAFVNRQSSSNAGEAIGVTWLLNKQSEINSEKEKLQIENEKLIQEIDELQQKNKEEVEALKTSNADLKKELEKKMEEAEKSRQTVAIFEEKYINLQKLVKQKEEDLKKALLLSNP